MMAPGHSAHRYDRPIHLHVWQLLLSSGARTANASDADWFYIPISVRGMDQCLPPVPHSDFCICCCLSPRLSLVVCRKGADSAPCDHACVVLRLILRPPCAHMLSPCDATPNFQTSTCSQSYVFKLTTSTTAHYRAKRRHCPHARRAVHPENVSTSGP